MPKNKGKGGKNRRRGKNENEETKRQLEFKEPGQEYSQVVRMLGNGRCECYCFDGVTRLGHIRGKMRTAPRGDRSGGLGPFVSRRRRGGLTRPISAQARRFGSPRAILCLLA